MGNKIIVAGVRNRLELWNEDMWDSYIQQVEGDIALLAEQLDQSKK